MANKDYYEIWLKLKQELAATLSEDDRIQELAVNHQGVKPQGSAVELVSRVYCKYCNMYNKLCELYDQMEQVQRRPWFRKMIDGITCRILELKQTLEEIEVFEFTYPDNALTQMLMAPQDIEILCPFFYPFEIREEEKQYIIDEIFAGNRIGDPEKSPSELERIEEERLEQEQILQEEKDAEIRRKLAMGEEIVFSDEAVVYTESELEEMRRKEEYERHILNIQRMERSRFVTRSKAHQILQDQNLYLELSGTKAPKAKPELRTRASNLIQMVIRKFQQLKREHNRETQLKLKLDMVIPSYRPISAKVQLEKVKEVRREFRRKYYKEWFDKNLKEQSRVFKLRQGDIMEDITTETKAWFEEWYSELRAFDEFPYPEEGGTILVIQGETFTIPEYIEWSEKQYKIMKQQAGAPKSKEEIKAEKLLAREEKRRIAQEARIREKKRLIDYKKQRLNPETDPGIHIQIGKQLTPLYETWKAYQNDWRPLDTLDPDIEVIKGYIFKLITEEAYKDANLQLRPIVDEMMRLELNLLKNALKNDCILTERPYPITQKRKKPKKLKVAKPDKLKPEFMFQKLVDEGIVKKYPKTSLDEFWGDRNYAAADLRAVMWTPSFPPHCVGDVKEQVRVRCLLALGASCSNTQRSHLFVGPKCGGKKTLIYAIASETNSILIDLSPMNVYNKFPGNKLKTLFSYASKISKIMQPTVILVENVDKMFYKKVPKEEKMFDPTRLSKDFYKEVIKPIGGKDKILVLGTAAEPWLAKNAPMYKAFPSVIMIPKTDYGSISYVLTKMLMEYHGVERNFNVHSAAQVLRGYDIASIKKAIQQLLKGDRIPELYHKPLNPMEILCAVLDDDSAICSGEDEMQMYQNWYSSYTTWNQKLMEYMTMLDCQLQYKLKAEKKGKKIG